MNEKHNREEIICCILADAFLDVEPKQIMPFIKRRLIEHHVTDIHKLAPLFYELVAPVVGFNLSKALIYREKCNFSNTFILDGIRQIQTQRHQSRFFWFYNKIMSYRNWILFHKRWQALLECFLTDQPAQQ